MKNRAGCARTLCCMLLIALLALSGYLGTQQRGAVQTVSVPVVFERIDGSLPDASEDMQSRLLKEREKAISLLEDVIRDPKATQTAVRQAIEKKTKMAERMEAEARTMQMLEQMGFSGAAVFCSETVTTVIVPQKMLSDQKARVQIIDAAASGTQRGADCIKIIPQKNE